MLDIGFPIQSLSEQGGTCQNRFLVGDVRLLSDPGPVLLIDCPVKACHRKQEVVLVTGYLAFLITTNG